MAESQLRQNWRTLRRNLWPLALLLASIFVGVIIALGVSGHIPRWLVTLATFL